MNTPWGKSQDKIVYAKGITFYSTAGHGGFKVTKDVLNLMPEKYRNVDGWYEEDCEAIKVMLAFPHLFPNQNHDKLKKSFDHWFNDDGTYKNLDYGQNS